MWESLKLSHFLSNTGVNKFMSCIRTTPHHLTISSGTANSDIGPSTGCTLHSITISLRNTDSCTVTLRDGGNSGTIIGIINQFSETPRSGRQVIWKGLKISGQLNVEVSGTGNVIVEISE
jgi:hypothetical protein